MSTTSQTDANRRNAQKSTGPRSAEGKATSSLNALKSGIDAETLIIRGESHLDLESLTALYQDRFLPATPEQSVLVDTLISTDWLLRRLRRAEPQIWEREFQNAERYEHYKKDIPLGDAFSNATQTFTRLQRRLDSMVRTYHRCLETLQRLRPDCFEPPTADPADPSLSEAPSSTENGFVPQPPTSTSENPGAPAPSPLPETAPLTYPPPAVTPLPPTKLGSFLNHSRPQCQAAPQLIRNPTPTEFPKPVGE
jgi:hypothetical protein